MAGGKPLRAPHGGGQASSSPPWRGASLLEPPMAGGKPPRAAVRPSTSLGTSIGTGALWLAAFGPPVRHPGLNLPSQSNSPASSTRAEPGSGQWHQGTRHRIARAGPHPPSQSRILRLKLTGRARPLARGSGPGHRTVRVGPCRRRDSTSQGLLGDSPTLPPGSAHQPLPAADPTFRQVGGRWRQRHGPRARAGERVVSTHPSAPRAQGDRCYLVAVSLRSLGESTRTEAEEKVMLSPARGTRRPI